MAIQQPTSTSPVLITGVTGHIGFAVLLQALRAGYTVRAAVRSPSKMERVLSTPALRALRPGPRLHFVVVPDITAPGAYEEACRGAWAVIHVASPLVTAGTVPAGEREAHFVQPAVRGTVGMLEAARAARTVRRVVVTSSITALMTADEMEGRGGDEDPASRRRASSAAARPVGPCDRVPFVGQPYEGEFAAYAASKVAALEAAERWMAETGPARARGLDVVHLHPSFVLGRNEFAASAGEVMAGTNSVVLSVLRGKKFGCSFLGGTVDVRDVAAAHVTALDGARVPGDRSYILSQPSRWNDAKRIAARAFPGAFQKGLLVRSGSVGSVDVPIDASLTEHVFGFTHTGFEEQVLSVVRHYLEVRTKKQVGLLNELERPGDVSAMGRSALEAF